MIQINDPVLSSFRDALDKIYGGWLQRVMLFGSRARGDAAPDSDYDVAVFLKDMTDRWKELDRLVPLRVSFLENHDADFLVLPFREADYAARTGLMHAIRSEGLPLLSRKSENIQDAAATARGSNMTTVAKQRARYE